MLTGFNDPSPDNKKEAANKSFVDEAETLAASMGRLAELVARASDYVDNVMVGPCLSRQSSRVCVGWDGWLKSPNCGRIPSGSMRFDVSLAALVRASGKMTWLCEADTSGIRKSTMQPERTLPG